MEIPRLRRILIILVGAFMISIIVTLVLQYAEGTQIESITHSTSTIVSNETVFGSTYEGFLKKGFFDSVGVVYVYLSSPYAKSWKIFNVWMSLDNSSWVSVPFLESTTSSYSQMANLGLINYGNPQLKIYMKSYIPPQTVEGWFKNNVTKQDVSMFNLYGIVQRQATPQDTTQWIITFFAVFGFIGFILSLLFQKDNSQNGKNRKKKPRMHSAPKKKEKYLDQWDSWSPFFPLISQEFTF